MKIEGKFLLDSAQDLGRWGESVAKDFLAQQGYTIIKQNYRNRFGEIDIIAKEKEYICFVEVKTRTADSQGHPLEAVTEFKQRKIIKVALGYLSDEDLLEHDLRFDIVSVIPLEGCSAEVELLQNAFEVDESF